MSAGCGPGCGWCGGCTLAWEMTRDEYEGEQEREAFERERELEHHRVLDDEDEGPLEPPF